MKYFYFTLFIFLPIIAFAQVENTIITKVNLWSEAISNQDFRTLVPMYADSVLAYGKTMSRKKTLRAKFDFYLKYPNFSQTIVSDVNVQSNGYNDYVCSFTKQYSLTGKPMEVTAYLYFRKINDVWQIVRETDDITEKRTKPKNAVVNKTVQPKVTSNTNKTKQFLDELLD
jgi:ketosteroid isomerase-like protein